MGKKRIDMIHQRFDKLIVVENIYESNVKLAKKVKCICDCGNSRIVVSRLLRIGMVKDCGCEILRKRKFLSHPLFNTWKDMIQRCYLKSAQFYQNYGGRGITVCDRWKDKKRGLENFINDIGEKPSNKHSLDRIDNNGDYSPENCRWATIKEQCRNRTSNRFLTYKGETKCVAEWCEILNISNTTLFGRLRKGWSIEKAFETPIKIKNK